MRAGKYRLPRELRDEAVRLYVDGWTLRQVAQHLYVSHVSVLCWLKQAGVARRPAVPGSGGVIGGELADVEPIREAFRQSGMSAGAVARLAGMDERQVARALGRARYVSWKTAGGERRRYEGVQRRVSYGVGAKLADALNVDYMEVGL